MYRANTDRTARFSVCVEVGEKLVGGAPIQILRAEGGGIFAVDGSFLEQAVGPIYDPFDGREVILKDADGFHRHNGADWVLIGEDEDLEDLYIEDGGVLRIKRSILVAYAEECLEIELDEPDTFRNLTADRCHNMTDGELVGIASDEDCEFTAEVLDFATKCLEARKERQKDG